MPRLRLLILFISFLAALAAGYALGRLIPSTDDWTLADLRAIDPLDSSPDTDITAIYARRHGFDCQVRLDLLTLPETPNFSLQISLEDQVFILPPNSPTITWDFPAATLTASLKNCSPRAQDNLQATLLAPNGQLLDQTPSLTFNAAPPNLRAAYLLAFYNTFSPAATPTQALRRWDGAHTGPRGERHGLRYLLANAEKYHIPLTLPGLATPETLSALDALGGLPQLRRMAQNNLLVLPLDDTDISYARNLNTAQAFNLPPASLCAEQTAPQPACRYRFLLNTETTIPASLDETGLSLQTRATLQNAILSPEPDVIFLGGDFQEITWGTPDYLAPAFAYLAARPYLIPITAQTLASISSAESASPAPAAILPPELQNLPQNPLATAALDAFFVNQTAPVELRASYANLPLMLAQAARWADSPQELRDCAPPTCVLASKNVLAFFQSDGRLVFLFVRDENGAVHQLVGPTAQFFIGLSDSSRWNPSAGLDADPARGNGAFITPNADLSLAPVLSSQFQFLAAGKSYQLLKNGIRVTIMAWGGENVQIPLAIDPWRRLEAGWPARFVQEKLPGGWQLGWENGPMVRIQAAGRNDSALDSPFDAIPLIQSPENPNAENPPGMYLPFGLPIVSFPAADLTLEITLMP